MIMFLSFLRREGNSYAVKISFSYKERGNFELDEEIEGKT
jgi:hypothetical protein